MSVFTAQSSAAGRPDITMADIASTSSDLPGAAPGYSSGTTAGLAPSPADVSGSASAVSWGAILAGAAGAAALSMILLVLGTGLGLSSASAFSSQGASAATLGMAGVFWITLTQLAASGMGGYLAGRLRSRWTAVHTDEVYFRDTAHGFLAWAVASLATAAFLTSAIGSIVGAGTQAAGAAAGGVASAAGSAAAAASQRPASGGGGMPGANDANGYFVDALFRPDMATAATPAADTATPAVTDPAAVPGTASTAPAAPAAPAASSTPAAPSTATVQMNTAISAEVSRIMATALRNGSLPADDTRYVARLVSQRTGLSQADAEKRVNDIFGRVQTRLKDAEAAARDAADKARKASAHTALWLFVSLLVGAFVASFAATFGGRQRDR